MRRRASIALLLCISACATSAPPPEERRIPNPRRANLQRAAALPWRDEGRCVVREASRPWPELVERCYPALEQERLQFHDPTGHCALASAGAAAVGLGLCVLAAPEFVAGAVIVTGVVVVGWALHEALREAETRPGPEPLPTAQDSAPRPRPKPEPKGPEFPPLGPVEGEERERRHRCEPIPVPHRGGDPVHNACADGVPNNSFPGWDVLVNGKNFDALQLATRTLWEVKTDDFEKQPPRSRKFFVQMKLAEIQREVRLARECGYDLIVGVHSEAHESALRFADPSLKIVVMDWC